MTKLSEEQIKANEEAAMRWGKITGFSTRNIADFFHYAERYGINVDQYIAEARDLYTADTTPKKKKMVQVEVEGRSADRSAKVACVFLDRTIPPNTKVRVIYEVEEEASS